MARYLCKILNICCFALLPYRRVTFGRIGEEVFADFAEEFYHLYVNFIRSHFQLSLE